MYMKKNLFLCKINNVKQRNTSQSRDEPITSLNNPEVYLNNHKFDQEILYEDLEFVTRYLTKQWKFIQNLVILEEDLQVSDLSTARKELNNGLGAILEGVAEKWSITEITKNTILESIRTIAVAVLPIKSFSNKFHLEIVNSEDTRSKAIDEYFHNYLEVRFYVIWICLKCSASQSVIEEDLNNITIDLVTLSQKYFEYNNNLEKNPFFCPCVRDSWLLIISTYSENLNCRLFWRKLQDLLKNEESLFSLWLLKGLLELNKELEMKDINNFIKDKLNEAMSGTGGILRHLKLLHSIICELLTTDERIDIISFLWEYFSKQLNKSDKYKSDTHIQCTDCMVLMKGIIKNPTECDEDFDCFIGLLLRYLKQKPNHWAKIKSRIFSQLTPFKIVNLDRIGVFRVFQLFIALLEVNLSEITKKFVAFYGALKDHMISATVINIYVVFVIHHVRKKESIETISSPLVETLQKLSEDSHKFHIIKEFLDDYPEILSASDSLLLHQWTLLDSWLVKYMATCYISDLESCANILLRTVQKVCNEQVWSAWENVLISYVYTSLKQVGQSSSCPMVVGELAAELSRFSTSIFNDSFNFFNAKNVNVNVTHKYLCTILKYQGSNFSLNPNQEKVAIQSWIKICLCSTLNYQEITQNILRLECLPTCVKEELTKSSNDPLVQLIQLFSRNENLFLDSPVLCSFAEMCFENLDQNLETSLSVVKDEVVTLRIYTCLGIAVLECGRLMYNRHKPSSPLTKIMSNLFFSELILKKIEHPFLDAIRKTWHIYFEGLNKLASDGDTYIQRVLRDLISKFMTFYSTAESPIFRSLDKENIAKVVLEKISTIYFKHPTKENANNVIKALKILYEYVLSKTSVNLLKLVVSETFFGLCEVFIFQDHNKNLALNIITYLITCHFYSDLRDEVMKSLLLVTEKHLAFNSKSYFNLINTLAKMIPSDIAVLVGSINRKIESIEMVRGIGYDEHLRGHLKSLNDALKC